MTKLVLSAIAIVAIFVLALAVVPFAQASAPAQAAACVETYTVVAGDTLGSVAQKYLGAIGEYQQVFNATNAAAKTDTSFKAIADANIIEVGQKLCIPAKAAGTTPAAGATVTATVATTGTVTAAAPTTSTVTATNTVTATAPTTTTTTAEATPTPVPGSPEGTYIATQPAADASALLWEVFIGPNGNAAWMSNYVGKGTSNATGTWEQTSENTFNLVLIHRDGENIGERFTFTMQGDTLVATDYNHSLYGDSGITLYKANAQVTGNVTYTQKIALPDDAVVEVYLLDVTNQDAPAYISGTSYRTYGQQVPLQFTTVYAPSLIKADGKYIVQAFISTGVKPLFRNSNGVAVISGGAPTSNVEIVVEQITP